MLAYLKWNMKFSILYDVLKETFLSPRRYTNFKLVRGSRQPIEIKFIVLASKDLLPSYQG